MREPTPEAKIYAWHANAMRGRLAEDPVAFNEDPECGWFKIRLVRGGPFVPARIWLEQPIDEETGLLEGDEVFRCQINGVLVDPIEQWPFLSGNPIAKSEYEFLMANAAYAERYAPHESAANPRKPVDWLRGVPTPKF